MLHWLTLALLLTQIALGWFAVSWRLSPTKLNLFVWHKSVGILILVIVLLRLVWRLGNATPALPDNTEPWERFAARLSHVLLYLFMIVIPLSGWVINSAANVPLNLFFWFPLPDITAPNKALAEVTKSVHFGLWISLCVLLVFHIGGALRHHLVKRNDILVRMWSGKKRT
jgi:cytochrome b561